MVYYDVKIKYELVQNDKKRGFYSDLRAINREQRRSKNTARKLLFYAFEDNVLSAVLMFDYAKISLSKAKERFESEIFNQNKNVFSSFRFLKTSTEITLETACENIENGIAEDLFDCFHDSGQLCEAYYADHDYVEFKEFLLQNKSFTLEQAKEEAEKCFADNAFAEELERIYSPLNKRRFYGNPVHYKINAASRETALGLVSLLAKALYANKRLVSARVSYVTETNPDGRRSDFDDLCENSYGTLVAVECKDWDDEESDFAKDSQIKSENIECNILHFASYVPFVLVDVGGANKLCKHCVAHLIAHDIDLVELGEKRGTKRAAKQYVSRLLKTYRVPYAKADLVLPEREEYSTFDIAETFNKIKRGSIKNSIYKAYQNCKKLEVEAPKSLSNSYDKLQQLVGLHDIKQIIDQIIAAQKMTKMRKDAGLAVSDSAKHMIFTGNPGSAKTTVARLLSSILFDEHVIEKPKFVECGRQDLVGRYVGWTAQQVEAKFREAKGGILFIDEAYSLVEKEGLYGDEAINTIVQMMENYREEVIVIFAGYPDKMQRFLAKNEGLRSRIAFHIDFPDYNGEELCAILELMCKNRGYTLETGAAEKCKGIFEIASHNAEFGNGRFVRNVLEQAIIKQSARLVGEYRGKLVDRETMNTLTAADFDINAAETYKPTQVAIGF